VAEQQRKQKTAPQEQAVEETEAVPRGTDRAAGLKEDIDDLLDEIDHVLEDNAEEFVRSYVQKGGE
jgi:ubiquitin-like protein Pup